MSAATSISNLTSGRLLARNTIWNLLGQLLPMAVAVVAIPPLIRGIGVARFGILSLAWIVVGYFSLFDLGIGRALTKLVADKLGAREEDSVPPLAWTALCMMLLLGLLGGLVTWAISPWLVHRALKIPETLQGETLRSLYLLALSIPIVTVTSGLRGILEALQRFRILNMIRIPMSVFSFAGPLLVLPFSASLIPVVAVLVLGRVIGALAHLLACFHAMPALRHSFGLEFSLMGPVLRFGGWMNVSNLMAPIMVYLDRFLIGALLSVSALAYYTAPFDLVNRLLIIPGAVTTVLFPAFAVSFKQDPGRARLLLSRGVKYIFLVTFPIMLIIVSLAPEGLRLWLGTSFADNGSSVLRWLAVGVFVNSLAYVPFAFIQAAGRPDITAKFQLVELPLYLLAIFGLMRMDGIVGVSIAWAGRVTADAALLFLFAGKLLPGWRRSMLRLVGAVAAALIVLCGAVLPRSLAIRTGFASAGLLIFGWAAWLWVLAPEERAFMTRMGGNTRSDAPSVGGVY